MPRPLPGQCTTTNNHLPLPTRLRRLRGDGYCCSSFSVIRRFLPPRGHSRGAPPQGPGPSRARPRPTPHRPGTLAADRARSRADEQRPMRAEDVTWELLKDVVRVQRRDLTGVVGIVGIIVTIFGSAVGLGVFFASSIGALDERIRVVEQEVAVLQVEIERLREDVSAIRTADPDTD